MAGQAGGGSSAAVGWGRSAGRGLSKDGPQPHIVLLGVALGWSSSGGLGHPEGPAPADPRPVLHWGVMVDRAHLYPRVLSSQQIPDTVAEGTQGAWRVKPRRCEGLLQSDPWRSHPPVHRGEGGWGERAWQEA